MSFVSNSGIKNGYYGTYKSIKNKDNDELEEKFVPLGNAVYVDKVFENIENNSISFKVTFMYMGKKRKAVIPRAEFFNKNKVDALVKLGIDVSPQNYNVFLDTIRRQEHKMAEKNMGVKAVFKNLGWIYLPVFNDNGSVKSYKPCFRASRLINGPTGEYQGDYKIAPMGNFEAWRQMVRDDILGHIVPEFVLVASLSAVIVGALAMKIPIENPIVHFYYLSGSGKSTMAHLAVSVIGQPFSGDQTIFNPKLEAYSSQKSLLQTWGSTSNAIILSQAGNRGVPTVLDELGKFNGKNPRDIIFNFSEGSDKMRANQELKVKLSEGYNTTFLSFGESSLLEKCKDKLEGLNVRVIEINKPMTESAEHSRRIKNDVKSNNGWAAPKLAEYIINNGGINKVVKLYNECVNRLTKIMPETEFSDRVTEKFYAIFIATAILAKKALDIDFDIHGLLEMFKENEVQNAKQRNISATSYEAIIEYFNINLGNFYDGSREIPNSACWGKYSDKPNVLDDGQVVVAEYAVRKNVVHNFLKAEGYQNEKACIAEWKAKGFLDYEVGKSTRKRKIIPTQKDNENVYVFRVFADEETAKEIKEEIDKKSKRIKLYRSNRQLLASNNNDEQGGETNDTIDATGDC